LYKRTPRGYLSTSTMTQAAERDGQAITRRGALLGLAAAASFGVSAPLAKLLLGAVGPTLLAGLLYGGAALSLWATRALRPRTREAPLRRSDALPLSVVVLAGGVLSPVLMLLGLSRLTALTGSLLLNLEAPFTMLLAVLFFGEHMGRRAVLSAVCIVGGAAVLKLEPGALVVDTTGMLLIAAACAGWALDNNFTQRLSQRDPFAVVRIKTTVSGLVNTAVALTVLRLPWPPLSLLLGALALGSVSYGLSVVLDAYALRENGASREAAYFATAPFLGALLSLGLFAQQLSTVAVAGLAMLSMVVGVWLMLHEGHSHRHEHEPLEHEHLHSHDAHHQHLHLPGDPEGDPHPHPHRHAALVHEHEHTSDLHHRHGHD
jgi:drug/metabolite transporter (DMT)-like permease